jgi:hypothetical protein
MDDKSENPETIPENEPIIPENPETIPKKEPIITEKNPEPSPQPKARGRPKGVKDAKPRIKRVPIQQEEEEPLPQVKVKKVEVRPPKREEPPPEEEDEESEEEAPLPSKSPRTIHRERMHQAATERRQFARDRQDRFERILDNFMGF